MPNYAWKKGSRQRASAQVAGEICEQLEQSGGLTAKRLGDVSRPKDAPLHNEFNWDNKEAAELWREQQARVLIASIVEVAVESENREPIRAFFNISHTEPEYESLNVIIQNEDKYQSLLRRAVRELEAFQIKYSRLLELSPVFDAIDALSESI